MPKSKQKSKQHKFFHNIAIAVALIVIIIISSFTLAIGAGIITITIPTIGHVNPSPSPSPTSHPSSTPNPTASPLIYNKNAVIIYDRFLKSSEYEFIASHFGLLDTEFGMTSNEMQSLKATNLDLKVIGYKDLLLTNEKYDDWSIVNSHEDWFVHDVNGVRVRWNTDDYGMNPGNVEWRTYFVNYINAKITAGNYDGVFLDDVWVGCYFQHVSPDTIRTDWYANVLSFITYIKANIGSGKIAMINSNEYPASTYANAVGAGMIEGFVRRWEGDIPTSLIMQQIDKLYLDSTNGVRVWCLSYGTQIKYYFSAYLLGVNGPNALFGVYQDTQYFPIMDTHIGSPTNAYYASQNVYMRDYTEGKVLFNPSSSSYTVNLGGTYKLLDGTLVSSLTLNAYSGEILRLGT